MVVMVVGVDDVGMTVYADTDGDVGNVVDVHDSCYVAVEVVVYADMYVDAGIAAVAVVDDVGSDDAVDDDVNAGIVADVAATNVDGVSVIYVDAGVVNVCVVVVDIAVPDAEYGDDDMVLLHGVCQDNVVGVNVGVDADVGVDVDVDVAGVDIDNMYGHVVGVDDIYTGGADGVGCGGDGVG